jgi:asparagine synthase (glutamine-hydrolysing)
MVSYLPAEKAERIRDMMNDSGDIMNDVMRFDIKNYMVEDLLLLSDKMSMAHGLEIRVPLIEYKIVESAFSIPASTRMGRAGSKSYLRNWFDGYMESRLPQSRKMGFSVPVEPFLRKLGKKELNLYFTQAELGEFLEKQEINKVLDSFFSGRRDTVNEIYALLVLAKWRLAHNL